MYFQEPEVLLNVDIGNSRYVVTSKMEGSKLKFELMINSRKYILNVTPEEAKKSYEH